MKLSIAMRAIFAILVTFLMADCLLAQPPRQRPPRSDGGERPDAPAKNNQQRPRTPDRAALPLMQALDANGDGVISADEIENATAALKTLDKNSDGKLERFEIFPQRNSTRRPREGRPQGQGGRPPSNMTDEPGTPPSRRSRDSRPSTSNDNSTSRLDTMISRFLNSDSNGDGMVSKSELPPQLRDRLMAADQNDDDQLSKEEIRNYFKGRMEAWDKRKTESENSQRKKDGVDTPPKDEDLSVDPNSKRRQLTGQPLGIRVMDDIDALVVTGNEEDVKAITEALEKAIKELDAKKSDKD